MSIRYRGVGFDPGLSQSQGSLLSALHEIVGVASPSVNPVCLHPGDGLRFLGFLSGVSSVLLVSSLRHLPCLSLPLVSISPRLFLLVLLLESLFLLWASLGLFLLFRCLLALLWFLMSPRSVLSPLWLLGSPPCLTRRLPCWLLSLFPRSLLSFLCFLSSLPFGLSSPLPWFLLSPPWLFLGWLLLLLLVSPPVPS